MKVYLSEVIHEEAVDALRRRAEIVDDIAAVDTVDGMVVRTMPITREILEKAKNLKVVGKHGIGCDNIDLDAAKELGIRVVYTPTANVNSVAELIVAHILGAARNITRSDRGVRAGVYKRNAEKEIEGIELHGRTLGLVGVGRIAMTVANIMRSGFGMSLVGYDPFVSAERCAELGVRKYDDLKEMVAVADVVSISVPLTDSTRNLVDASVLARFKPDAILVNAARGCIVNETDLCDALKAGRLRCACSDVFVKEPPEKDNPLVGLENFVSTPHAGSNTKEALYRLGTTVVDEVLRVLDGKEPNFPVV